MPVETKVVFVVLLCLYKDRREDASNLGREACGDGAKGSCAHLTLRR